MSSENSSTEDFLNIDFVQPECSPRGDDQSLLSLDKNPFGAMCSDYADNCSRLEASSVKETGIIIQIINKLTNIYFTSIFMKKKNHSFSFCKE